MRIFIGQDGWDGKINFVDENNVLLGYDRYQQCCENANWFISDTVQDKMPEDQEDPIERTDIDINLEGWTFDISFLKEYSVDDCRGYCEVAVFRIVKDNQEKFIHLYNVHNGYYSHGFSFRNNNNKIIKEGEL